MTKDQENQKHEMILSEDEIRERMTILTNRFPEERAALREAYAKLAKKEAKTHLAITFQEYGLLNSPTAKKYLQMAKNSAQKLTVADKEMLLILELSELKEAYDLAKFDCETTEKDYAKLQPQLSFYQTIRKDAIDGKVIKPIVAEVENE